jgi:integrative and conjugative element protein (TIGR02256 family)
MKSEVGKDPMNNLKQKVIYHLSGMRKALNISSKTTVTISHQTVLSAENTIRFEKSDGYRLIIDGSVVNKFIAYQQHGINDKEAGGLLLGRHLKDGSHLAVDYLSEPQHGDKRSRFGFFRGKGHQKIAHQFWDDHNGTCTYLGNWHTHPEPYPTPSITDKYDWTNVLRNDTYEGNHLYFIIVGTIEIACWEGTRNSQAFTKLNEYK